jgi:hypothetical protein
MSPNMEPPPISVSLARAPANSPLIVTVRDVPPRRDPRDDLRAVRLREPPDFRDPLLRREDDFREPLREPADFRDDLRDDDLRDDFRDDFRDDDLREPPRLLLLRAPPDFRFRPPLRDPRDVSPASDRSLLTVRAAICSALSLLMPRRRPDALMCSYWRPRLLPFLTPRGGIPFSFRWLVCSPRITSKSHA